jgi:Caspase domain
MKRRHLLQAATATIVTAGLPQLTLDQQAAQCAQALTGGTARRRALLVGINNYGVSGTSGWKNLNGAVNDVDLQYYLLIYRFGFRPEEIVKLTDQQASRQRILTELENLIKWAKPNDVVVFHFSGHGSNVYDPLKVHKDQVVGTIVPADSALPVRGGGEVDDITAGTLFLLMSAFQTDNVTFILDSCYSGGAARGNLTTRSRPGHLELRAKQGPNSKLDMSKIEVDYQKKLLKQLNLTEANWVKQRQQGVAKGAVLYASQRAQEAIDVTFNGDFSAGLFTYALTHYLWQQASSVDLNTTTAKVVAETESLLYKFSRSAVQKPFSESKSSNRSNTTEALYRLPYKTQPSDGVIIGVEGRKVTVFLSGITPEILQSLGKKAQLAIVDSKGVWQGTIQIETLTGIKAEASVVKMPKEGLRTGMIIQEMSRIIPANFNLRIGIDSSFSEQDITTAKSILTQSRIVPITPVDGKISVDYILARITQRDLQAQNRSKNLPPLGAIGLFFPGQDLIPLSLGKPNESVKEAIARLTPKLNLLLAARLLKLLINPNASQLKDVKISLQVNEKSIAEAATIRGSTKTTSLIPPGCSDRIIPCVKATERFRIGVENNSDKTLNVGMLILSPEGDINPSPWGVQKVEPGKKLQIPSAELSSGIRVAAPFGIFEVLVIASIAPIDKAMRQLETLSSSNGSQRGPNTVSAVDSLLDEISVNTRGGKASATTSKQIDNDQLAALSLSFNVVE